MAEKVLLRVKRKRTDEPIEKLAVLSQLILQKKVKLEDALSELNLSSTTEKKETKPSNVDEKATPTFVFTRIDTVASTTDEKQVQKRLVKSIRRHYMDNLQRTTRSESIGLSKSNHEQSRKQKRSQRLFQGRGLNLVDVTLPGVSPTDVTINGAMLKSKSVKRVLNPMERNVDESIWIAFQKNDFSMFFRVKHEIPHSLVFQRLADGGTILMAAAMHNRIDVIEKLLELDSSSIILRDWNGQTAADIATSQGHAAAASALRACEVIEIDKDYVYDVYSIDMEATNEALPAENVPVVTVSSSVERWLSNEAFGDLDSEDRELVYDVDSSGSEYNMDDDIDSNAEDHEFNDYPDEEEDDSDEEESRYKIHDEEEESQPWKQHEEFDGSDY